MFSNDQNTKRPLRLMLSSGTALLTAAILALPMVATTAAPAEAVTKVKFDGSKARVNLSGRLGMLAEKIASTSCRINARIDAEATRVELDTALKQFSEITSGLRDGNTKIGIPNAESKARILSAIWELEQVWVQVKYAGEKIVDGVRVDQYTQVVNNLTSNLQDQTQNLSEEILAQYTNPAELLTGDAFTINIAGRQRKLSQEMSKTVCGIGSGQEGFGSSNYLVDVNALFEKSLAALENGFPAAGVSPPPNDFVKSVLAKARAQWGEIKDTPVQSLELASVVNHSKQFNELQTEMNNLVTLYMLATPGQDDVYRVPLEAYANNVLSEWLANPSLIAAVKAQNHAHQNLGQSSIDALDLQWRAEVKSDGSRPLVEKLLSSDSSKWLADQQVASAGLVTEVFVMDNKGLNVAQSAATSDYWQGDEAKWKETFGNQSGSIHISEVEFDDSTGSYQSQVSMPVRDPSTGELIGAVTFGVNVQSFL